MHARKIVVISVLSTVGVIVLLVAALAGVLFLQSRGDAQQNFKPSELQRTVSPAGNAVIVSQATGSSSFLYLQKSGGTPTRLSKAVSGIESEGSFSHNGRLVVYSYAAGPDSKSAVWVVGVDGTNPHVMTSPGEDALHPVFSPDDTAVFYATSSFTGHHSPIVRPARHDWDIYVITLHPTPGEGAKQITHASFYDLKSIDVTADDVSPGHAKLLLSTSGYPIGDLLQEFSLESSGRNKTFQPHVPGQSAVGPSFGQARFVNGGMDIVFLAASDSASGTYDYNVYFMSDVTGGELRQLTHLKGMTTDLGLTPDQKATFLNDGALHAVDLQK